MSIYEFRPILIYSVFLAFCLGACMGSFLNCAAWRITHGESFIRGRSHCPFCGHELGLVELIPVFGWLILKGRCRHCREKISVRYLLTEIIFGAITAMCLLRFDLTVLCLRNYIFLCILFLLTLTDIEDMIIPDGCHVAALLVWVAAEPFLFAGWKDVGFSILSLGGGDIKLFGVVGLYLGLIGTLFTVVLACAAGLVFHLFSGGRKEEGQAFPFGPWIAGAAAVMLLYGASLVSWYLGLLGL